MPRVPVPFSDYSDTRLSADEQSCVNMYPHSRGGLRQFPGLLEFASLGVPSLSSEIGSITDMGDAQCSNDGTKFYNIGSGSTTLTQRTLSTAFDLSTAGTPETETLSAVGYCIEFSFDGSTLFVGGLSTVYEYALSTAWDVTTATLTTSFSTTSQTGASAAIRQVRFGNLSDGEVMFVLANDTIYQYDLTTDFDLSTASYASKSLDVSTNTSGALSFDWDFTLPSRITVWGSAGIDIYKAAGTDLGTTEYTGTVNLNDAFGADIDADLLTFINSGQGILVYSRSADKVYHGALGTSAYKIATAPNPAASTPVYLRGSIVVDKNAFIVWGSMLYRVSTIPSVIYVGEILGDSDAPVGMETDGDRIVITADTQSYSLTLSNLSLTEITDADLGDTKSSAHLDSRYYFSQENGEVAASALNDPTSVDALDFFTAESFGDDVIRVLAVDQLLYVFGSKSIEIFYSSGAGRPPVDRQKVIDEVGLRSTFALTVIDNTIYFLDNKRRLNRMRGGNYEPLYVPGVSGDFSGYLLGNLDQVTLTSYSFEQENFIEIDFPLEGVTWSYHEPSGRMSKRETTATQYVDIDGTPYGLDSDNGKVYELSATTYQDDGSNITRTVDTQLITSELYGAPGRDMTINGIFPTFEASGSGTVTVSISKDGGAFGNSRDISVTSGTNKFRLHQWGKCREAIFRFTTTSNIKLDFVSLSADAEILND